MSIIEEALHQLGQQQSNSIGGQEKVALAVSDPRKPQGLRRWFPVLLLLAMALVVARQFYGDAFVSVVIPSTPSAESVAPAPVAKVVEVPIVASASSVAMQSELPTESIAKKIDDWASAWSSRDIERYLAHYAGTFKPADGMEHKRWVEQRRLRIGRQTDIQIEIRDLHVLIDGKDVAIARFTQNFQSAGFKEIGTIKELKLIWTGDSWKIFSERIVSVGANAKKRL